MPSLVPTVPLNRPPEDWRKRILTTLASEGVTEPAYVPAWCLFIINLAKIFGWVAVTLSPTIAALQAAPYLPDREGVPLFLGSLLVDLIIFRRFTSALMLAAGRRWRVEWSGP